MVGEVQSFILSVRFPNCCRSVFGRGGEQEPEGVSIPAVIRSGGAAPRARERRSLLLTEMLREARAIAKATAVTPSQQKLTVAVGAPRARTAKARRKNAHANEASLLLAKHAKEEPPDRGMLALGDRRIAMLVAEPFAVLPVSEILARLPERQASSTDRRALVEKVRRENRQTRTSIAWAARASVLTTVPSAIAPSRSRCGATWHRFSSSRLPRSTRPL